MSAEDGPSPRVNFTDSEEMEDKKVKGDNKAPYGVLNSPVHPELPPEEPQPASEALLLSETKAEPVRYTACDLVSKIIFVILSLAALIGGFIALAMGGKWLVVIRGTEIEQCFLPWTVGLASTIVGALVVFLIIVLGLTAVCLAFKFKHPVAALTSKTNRKKSLKVCCYHLVPVVLIIFAAAFSVLSIWILSLNNQLPNTGKNFEAVKGLDGRVTILRDGKGIPHIRAVSKGDALFAQGLVTAQDRLWQLEFLRLAGRGELSSVLGKAAKNFDKQARILNFRGAAEVMYNGASQESLSLIQRYVDGINFYIDNYKERPTEFLFFDLLSLRHHQPRHFAPIDVMLSMRLLQWEMGYNLKFEILRFNIFWRTKRTYDEIRELFVDQVGMNTTILSREDLNITDADVKASVQRDAKDFEVERRLYDGPLTELRRRFGCEAPGRTCFTINDAASSSGLTAADGKERRGITSPGFNPDLETVKGGDKERAGKAFKANSMVDNMPKKAKKGKGDLGSFFSSFDLIDVINTRASNAWGAHSAGGATFGASDPHLPVTLPSVWHPVHLSFKDAGGQDFDIAGVSAVGMPGVHIGKTTHVSWGITLSLTDLEDLFIIIPDPDKPETHYVVNGTSLPYTIREEVIKVRGGGDFTVKVRETVYGPISNEAIKTDNDVPLALWIQSFKEDTASLEALLNILDTSTDTAVKFRDRVFGRLKMPGLSVVAEDVAGDIVYIVSGQHFKRAVGHTGLFPTLGNGSFDHQFDIPYPELPTLVIKGGGNKSGQVSAANYKIYPDGYKYSLGMDYDYPFRGRRLQELLKSNPDKLSSLEFHKSVQTDVRSNFAAALIDLLSSSAPDAAAFRGKLNPEGAKLFARLVDWDKNLPVGSNTGVVFWTWARQLLQSPTDAIQAIYETEKSNYWMRGYLSDVLRQIENPTALQRKACGARLGVRAWSSNSSSNSSSGTPCGFLFAQLLNYVAADPPSPKARWGFDLREMYLTHLMTHDSPAACFFERKSPKGGDSSSVNVGNGKYDDEMFTDKASSMRQIYDWSTPNFFHFAFPGGPSGSPFSKYYTNLLKMFSENEYYNYLAKWGDDLTREKSSEQVLNPV